MRANKTAGSANSWRPTFAVRGAATTGFKSRSGRASAFASRDHAATRQVNATAYKSTTTIPLPSRVAGFRHRFVDKNLEVALPKRL